MVTPQATGPCCSVSARDQMLADIHLLFRRGEIKRTALSEPWSWIFMKNQEEVRLVIDNCALDTMEWPEQGMWELGVTCYWHPPVSVPRLRDLFVCLCHPCSQPPAHCYCHHSQFLCPSVARASQAKPRLVFNCNCKVSRRLGTQQAIPSVPS